MTIFCLKPAPAKGIQRFFQGFCLFFRREKDLVRASFIERNQTATVLFSIMESCKLPQGVSETILILTPFYFFRWFFQIV